jgi:hypothetical protein
MSKAEVNAVEAKSIGISGESATFPPEPTFENREVPLIFDDETFA